MKIIWSLIKLPFSIIIIVLWLIGFCFATLLDIANLFTSNYIERWIYFGEEFGKQIFKDQEVK